jgi:hypothetical protein
VDKKVCGIIMSMEFEEILKKYKRFTEEDLRFLIKKGVISEKLTEKDLFVLRRLHKIWGTESFMRFAFKNMKLGRMKKIYYSVCKKKKLGFM